MFKVGDRVKCVNVNQNQHENRVHPSYSKYLNQIGEIIGIDDDDDDDGLILVQFDHVGLSIGYMYDWRFRLVEATKPQPQKFGLDVTFTNVDDAIAVATQLAANLNRPVGVINVT